MVFSAGEDYSRGYVSHSGAVPCSPHVTDLLLLGPFRIYRAPGSVAFLNCGSALQPILPKSQCWCVDEASSKYVLQIRRPHYWRIEVPIADDHDIRLALELREVLDKVLQFEKTECPFRRTFTVELPERPQTAVKKRPWTPPVRRSLSALPPTPVTPMHLEPIRPEAQEEFVSIATEEKELEVQQNDTLVSEEVVDIVTMDQTEPSNELEGDSVLSKKVDAAVSALEHIVQKEKDAKVADLSRPNGFQASRSVTSPPHLTLVTPSSPLASASEPSVVPEAMVESSESHSPTASHDSFHSIEAWTSPLATLPPSPPLTAAGSPQVPLCPQDYLLSPKTRQSISSDLTITPNTPTTSTRDSSEAHHYHDESTGQQLSVHDDEASSVSSVLSTAESLHSPPSTIQSDQPSSPTTNDVPITKIPSTASTATHASVASPPSPVLTRRPYMRHRPTTSSSISPSRAGALPRIPSAANLFSSYRNQSSTQPPTSKLSLVRRLPMAVIHKTCEIFFSPPSHLINLMLKVAARIAAGEWRGYVFGLGEQGETIPVRWDWSDEDDEGEGELGGWHADEDWGFGRHATRTPLKMAGAFPESPDENDDQRGRELSLQSTDRDESPSRGHSSHGSWSVD